MLISKGETERHARENVRMKVSVCMHKTRSKVHNLVSKLVMKIINCTNFGCWTLAKAIFDTLCWHEVLTDANCLANLNHLLITRNTWAVVAAKISAANPVWPTWTTATWVNNCVHTGQTAGSHSNRIAQGKDTTVPAHIFPSVLLIFQPTPTPRLWLGQRMVE